MASYTLRRPRGEALGAYRSIESSVLARLKAAADETRELERMRDGLLPLLMSGRVRVRDAERVVEDAL